MHFILDYRAARIADYLREKGEVTFFDAGKLVYPAISGHPDIFMSRVHNHWILAPNIPPEIVTVFETLGIPYIIGKSEVGFRYPGTALYNHFCDSEVAVISRHTDEAIVSRIKSKEIITVNQGYIACNLARIGNEFITSDSGIEKELASREKIVRFVKPDHIRLAGVPNGFIGGTLGQSGDKVFYTGSHGSSCAAILSAMCASQNKELVFLGKEEALDVGGIIVL